MMGVENDGARRHDPPRIMVMGLTFLPLMVILLVCTPLPRLALKWLAAIPWMPILRQVPLFAMMVSFAPVLILMECSYNALARWRLTGRETFMAWFGGMVGVTYLGVVGLHLVRPTVWEHDISVNAVVLGGAIMLLCLFADVMITGVCERFFLRLLFPDYPRLMTRLKEASRDVDGDCMREYVFFRLGECVRLPEPLTDRPEWVDRNMPLLERCANYCPDLFDSVMRAKTGKAATHEE